MLDIVQLPDLLSDDPAGPDLGLDNRFNEMEAAARGKPEGQFGNTIEPAVRSDWRLTNQIATELLGETRDLRIMAIMAVARLNLAGLPAFAACLGMIRDAIERHWDDIHPRLDPEDDNDPMSRANALLVLRNPVTVIRAVREAPLATVSAETIRAMQDAGQASLPRSQPLSYQDLAVLSGSISAEPDKHKLSEAEARDIFAAAEPAERAALDRALVLAIAAIDAIGATFDTRAQPGSGPDLTPLSKILRDVQRELEPFAHLVATPLPALSGPGADGAMASPSGAQPGTGAMRAASSVRAISVIGSRDEALHALHIASAYFRAHEPSSPLPLLIDRAVRLASMPFLDLLRDLAPDGVMQALVVAGPQESPAP